MTPAILAATAAIAVFASLACAPRAMAAAEEAQPPITPYTRECQTGDKEVQSTSPLPNVASALEAGKTLSILAIGSSPRPGRYGHGNYREEIEKILARAIKGLNVVIVNRGISGELAADAAMRIRTEVALNEPDLVLWQVGANDALAYLPVNEVVSTVVDTVRWLRQHKVDVILVGLQAVKRMQRNEHYIAVRDALRKVAQDENVIMIRRDDAMQMINKASTGGTDASNFPEEVERSQVNHACLAEYVARAITIGAFAKGLKVRARDGKNGGQEAVPPGASPGRDNQAPAKP
ncbi:MAG TPA: SGNH/GDSL hydrolase family protein [Xanthobacteraceae bacterium]|nr:SGNH/GDSL hydrolase family protein [Xanthobacteraceae bacterium]